MCPETRPLLPVMRALAVRRSTRLLVVLSAATARLVTRSSARYARGALVPSTKRLCELTAKRRLWQTPSEKTRVCPAERLYA